MVTESAKILVEKICKEREQFRELYLYGSANAYNDYYKIFFYEMYHSMLTNDYILERCLKKDIIEWLSKKDNPLDFLYDKWLYADGYLSDNWDDMAEFIGLCYTNEMVI